MVLKKTTRLRQFLYVFGLLVLFSALRSDSIAFALRMLAAWAADMDENGLLTPFVSLVVCVVSVVSSTIIAVYGNRNTQKREYEMELRDSFLAFYDPLLALLNPLSEYLGSTEASAVDLADYDPRKSSHRKKLANVSAFADGLETIFRTGKSALSAKNSDLSRYLSTLRLWILAIEHLSRVGEKLAGRVPSDQEVLDAISEIRCIIAEEKDKLFRR